MLNNILRDEYSNSKNYPGGDSDNLNETDLAKKIASGDLPSPQQFANIWLFDLRITGTGVSYRVADKQFCFRDPDRYLNDGFIERCNGLPVILTHPDNKSLDTESFRDQVIGTISYPYIKGSEVWGIARIYDAPAAEMMATNILSTSPMVVCKSEDIDIDGKSLAIEGDPLLIDHIAIVNNGVWDKGGEPSGIKSNLIETEVTLKDREMSEEIENKTSEGSDEPKLSDLAHMIKGIAARMDTLEAAKARTDEDAKAKAADDEDEARKNADNAIPSREISDMSARVDKLADSIKKSEEPDNDGKEKADAQARADAVYQMFGDSAPRSLIGESLLAYRKRLAIKYKNHSKTYADVDIIGINDKNLIGIIEKQIYADAQTAATDPSLIPIGTLIERSRKDGSGRTITEFYGKPSAWMNEFKRPKQFLSGIKI